MRSLGGNKWLHAADEISSQFKCSYPFIFGHGVLNNAVGYAKPHVQKNALTSALRNEQKEGADKKKKRTRTFTSR